MADGIALDLGWFPVFRELDRSDHPNRSVSGLLRQRQSLRDAVYDGILRDMPNSGFEEILLFAEQLVVNEYFVVDALALNAGLAAVPDVLAPFVQRRDPPIEVYKTAAAEVLKLTRSLWDSAGQSPALTQLLGEMSSDRVNEFWSGPEKRLHEYMERSGASLQMVSSAESTGGDTLSRALFYLEFGKHLGDVPLLGPGKRRWLQIIGEGLKLSLHQTIANRFDGKVLAELHAQCPQAFESTTLRTPPVAELILKKGIAEGLPLMEAAIIIRDTPVAIDYRGMLSELKDCLRRGRSGALKAQKALVGLDKLAESWAKYNDSTIGVTRRPRRISFQKLPVLNELLESVSMSEVEILDWILERPPGYLAFMSSWYRDQPTP